MRKANVFMHNQLAGILEENEEGYFFSYFPEYLQSKEAKPISLTLPFQQKPHCDKNLFAFFDGLIPEGWLLDIAQKNWKLNRSDRMGLLLSCCSDCIGAVHVKEMKDES